MCIPGCALWGGHAKNGISGMLCYYCYATQLLHIYLPSALDARLLVFVPTYLGTYARRHADTHPDTHACTAISMVCCIASCAGRLHTQPGPGPGLALALALRFFLRDEKGVV